MIESERRLVDPSTGIVSRIFDPPIAANFPKVFLSGATLANTRTFGRGRLCVPTPPVAPFILSSATLQPARLRTLRRASIIATLLNPGFIDDEIHGALDIDGVDEAAICAIGLSP